MNCDISTVVPAGSRYGPKLKSATASRPIAHAGGYKRIDSDNTISTYRRRGMSSYVGSPPPSTWSNSEWNRAWQFGFSERRYQVQVRAIATVSYPAKKTVS